MANNTPFKMTVRPKVLNSLSLNGETTLNISLSARDGLAPTTSVRLVVYDVEQYFADQAIKFANSKNLPQFSFETNLHYFVGGDYHHHPVNPDLGQLHLVLPEYDEPEVKSGSGVLFIADLVLHIMDDNEKKFANQKGWGYWYVMNRPRKLEQKDPACKIWLEIVGKRRNGRGKTDKNDEGDWGQGSLRQLIIGYAAPNRSDVLALGPNRHLAVRVTSLQPNVSPSIQRVGTVIYSNLHKEHNTVGLMSGPLSRAIIANYSVMQAALKPGGSGTSPPPSPQLPQRTLTPDLTGLYEQEVDGCRVAPSVIWLHQAGSGRVGWYYPVRLVAGTLVSTHAAAAELHSSCFCFMLDRSGTGKWPLRWCDVTGADPTILRRNVVDPTKVKIETGSLEILCILDGTRIKVTLHETGGSRSAIYRRAPAIATRIPNGAIASLPANYRWPVWRGKAEILPPTVVTEIGYQLSQNNTQLVSALSDWQQGKIENDENKKEIAGRNVGEILENLIGCFGNIQRDYRNEARVHIKSFAYKNRITAGRRDERVLKWFDDIIVDKMQRLKIDHPDSPDSCLYKDFLAKETGWRGFADAKIQPSHGTITYEFKFDTRQASLQVVVQGAFGGFKLDIVKKRGATQEWQSTYYGVFLGLGAGLGVKGKIGAGGGAGAPVSCTITHFADLYPQDFNHATFKVTALVGPGASVTVAKVETSSSFIVITLRGGEEFQAEVDNVFEHGPDLPSLNHPPKGLEFEGTIFAVTASYGILLKNAPAEIPRPDVQKPIVKYQDISENARLHDPIALFSTGSSNVENTQLPDVDVQLATYRYLLEIPGWLDCHGYTSPEWKSRTPGANCKRESERMNKLLSRHRATAVWDAIKAGVGEPGQGIINKSKNIACTGHGRETSLNPKGEPYYGGGLLDPCDPNSDKNTVLEQQNEKYHEWRRVDLLVNGVVVVVLKDTI